MTKKKIPDCSSLAVIPGKTSRREKNFKTVSFILLDISVFLKDMNYFKVKKVTYSTF